MKRIIFIIVFGFVVLAATGAPIAYATVATPKDHNNRVLGEVAVIGANLVLSSVNLTRFADSGGSLTWGAAQLALGGATFALTFSKDAQLTTGLAVAGFASIAVGLLNVGGWYRSSVSHDERQKDLELSPTLMLDEKGRHAPGVILSIRF